MEVKEKNTPLSSQKQELAKELRDFKHRFIVVIDDIDRLEPAEAAEIVRLVRAVGDFPNIVYLLCYDRDVLAHSLENAIEVIDGKAFLQKIVQISFPVPRPEEFDLRRWFFEECTNLHSVVIGQELGKEVSERLAAVCDTQGQLLQTPRDVGHVVNALRLVYPAIANNVDFADLCWLQILRLKNDAVYKWVEEYLNVFAAVKIDRASVNEGEEAALTDRLGKLLSDTTISTSPHSVWYFGQYIPGVVQGSMGDLREITVLQEVNEDELIELERNNRLGSPHHYRLYFAFSQPAGTLHDTELSTLIDNADNGISIVDELEQLVDKKRPQGGTMYEVMLDRIKRIPAGQLSLQAAQVILSAIGDTVDRAQHNEREAGFFGRKLVWHNAKTVFSGVLKRIDTNDRKTFLDDFFTNRKSIGWLLAEIIGDELFAHGRTGNNTHNYDKTLLTKDELDVVIKIMFSRLAGTDRDNIIGVPSSVEFFYRWHQAGGDADLKRWMDEQSQTDKGFLTLMGKCRGWAASGKEVYHPLNKRDLQVFMDFDQAVKRLQSISQDINKPAEDRHLAKELLEAVRIRD